MPQERQHYVPKVYLKSWEGSVCSLSNGNTIFNGVYIFDKNNLSVGDGRTRKKILFEKNIYTIDFENRFIGGESSEILNDFAKQTHKILDARNVCAFCNGTHLSSEFLLSQNFSELHKWIFQSKNNSQPNKVEIIKEIETLKSYVIESAFDKHIENKWVNVLTEFLAPAESMLYGHGQIEYRYPNEDTPIKMFEMFTYMHSRNPRFDMLGLLPPILDVTLGPLLKDVENRKKYINEMRRNLWLSEIYKGLNKCDSGFFHSSVKKAFSRLGFILFKIVDDDEGCFITSDNPAFTYLSSVTKNNSNGMYFPLTPRYLLFVGNNSDGQLSDMLIRTIRNSDIKCINGIIRNMATKTIVTNNKNLGYIL